MRRRPRPVDIARPCGCHCRQRDRRIRKILRAPHRVSGHSMLHRLRIRRWRPALTMRAAPCITTSHECGSEGPAEVVRRAGRRSPKALGCRIPAVKTRMTLAATPATLAADRAHRKFTANVDIGARRWTRRRVSGSQECATACALFFGGAGPWVSVGVSHCPRVGKDQSLQRVARSPAVPLPAPALSRRPAWRASAVKPSIEYLCEYSVTMCSPAEKPIDSPSI
jgi:hypothetical protein